MSAIHHLSQVVVRSIGLAQREYKARLAIQYNTVPIVEPCYFYVIVCVIDNGGFSFVLLL